MRSKVGPRYVRALPPITCECSGKPPRRVRYESFIYPIVTSIPGLPSISKARKHSSSGWGLPKPCILDNSTRRRGLPRWYSRVRGKKRARAVVETVWAEANAGYDNEIPAVSRSA